MTINSLLEIAPESDGLHVAGDDPWWREAWYFEFYDANSEIQFQAYQGVFPNASTGDLNAAFFHQGKLVEQIQKMDFRLVAEHEQERLCFGPLKMVEVEALKRWRLQYDSGEIQADLYFDAVHPAFSWAAANLWMEASSDPQLSSNHFDQLGRYTGKVWIHGQEYPVDALGFRDRMWGWGGRKHWQSYLVMWAAFDEDCVANVAIQRFDDGRQTLCGYLCMDENIQLLQRVEVDVEWDLQRWKTVSRVHVEVEDTQGRKFNFSGRPQGISDTSHRWPQRSDHMLFSVGEYQSGDRIGHGVLNWAFTNEADRPQRLEATLETAGE
jgi:hypothetical protein